jgi:hypothetical protein
MAASSYAWLRQMSRYPGEWLNNVQRRHEYENELITEFARMQALLGKAALRALLFGSDPWRDAAMDPPLKRKKREQGAADRRADDPPANPELTACEQLLALVYTSFILVVLVRMRALVVALGGIYVFLLLGVGIYPFQPQAAIRLTMMVLLVFIIGIVANVYVQMHRDPILSYITETEPGQLGWEFWVRMTSLSHCQP